MSEIVKIYPYKYTPQEELFCELYADTGIISKAYHLAYGRDANYSFDDTKEKKTCHTRGYRMLKKPHIEWLMDWHRKKRVAELKEEFKVERVEIIEKLMKVADFCMKAQVKYDRNGKPTPEERIDSTGANKALELLGKTVGMFGTDTVDLSQINIEVKLSD